MSKINIKQVKQSYKCWRAGRGPGRGETPVELRELALGLAKRYGDKAVMEALGLSSASLWNWRRSGRLRSRRDSEPVHPRKREIKFVEVKPAAVMAPTVGLSVQVELQRGDGQRMRVEGLQSMEQVRELALGFLRADVGGR